MEEIIKFQHSHYEHVIRQLKSENQSLKETIQMLNNQKKNPTPSYPIPNQFHLHHQGGLVNSMMIPEFNNQQQYNGGEPVYEDHQNKGLNYHQHAIVMGEVPMTPHVNNNNRGNGNSMMNSRMQQQRMSNGGSGDYQHVAASMSPLSTKSSSRMSSTNYHQKEDFNSGRRSSSNIAEKLRSASPKLPSVSPIRASPNQNLNESLSIIMNQAPSSPSGFSDMTNTRLSNNARLSMNENIDPKTPMKGKSILPNKTPQPSNNSTNRSVLQPRATPQLGSKQSSINSLTNSKSILPSSSRSSTSEVQQSSNNTEAAFVENQANDLGLPNRSQLKDKPLLKRKVTAPTPETPPLSSLGVQKQNKTLPSNTMDPTRTPLLSRKLISLSTPSRQRPQSSRGIPPKL